MEVYRTRLGCFVRGATIRRNENDEPGVQTTQVTRHTFDGIGYINDVMPDVWVGYSCAQVCILPHTADTDTPGCSSSEAGKVRITVGR